MNLFSIVMDSCKESMQLSSKSLKIFVPYIVSTAITAAIIIVFILISVIAAVGGIVYRLPENIDSSNIFAALGTLIIGGVVIAAVVLPVIYSIVEAGLLGMLKSLLQNGQTRWSDFFRSVREKWLGMLGGSIVAALISVIVTVIAAVILVLAHIITLGWGMLLGTSILYVFLGAWSTIYIIEETGPVNAITRGFYLGKRYFWALLILGMANTLLAMYLSQLASSVPIVGLLFASIAAAVVGTYFKLVLMRFYLAVRESSVKTEI